MGKYQIHPKVALPVFAGALVNVIISIAKTRWGIDLSAEQTNLTIIAMGLVGYFVPGEITS